MGDISIIAAFAAGTISFLSPCVLPLVPGYISIVSGISLDKLQAEAEDGSSMNRTVLFNSIFFILGFSTTFIALGASASVVGQVLMSQMSILYRIAGVLIIVFGLHLIGVFKIPFLYQDTRFHNVKPRGHGRSVRSRPCVRLRLVALFGADSGGDPDRGKHARHRL